MQVPARWLLALVMVSAGLLIGLATRPLDAQQNVLASKKVAAPPPMEPAISDAWKAAPPLTVRPSAARISRADRLTSLCGRFIRVTPSIFWSSTKTRRRAFSVAHG
jgi:hypothetical protein